LIQIHQLAADVIVIEEFALFVPLEREEDESLPH
jgi:hypothetical protein